MTQPIAHITVTATTVKFFKNGVKMSNFCRMRYGQSKLIWADPTLWAKAGQYAIRIDLAEIDKKFRPIHPEVC